MDLNNRLLALRNHGDDKGFGLLAVSVSDGVIGTVVDESVAPGSMCFGANIPNLLLPTRTVDLALIVENVTELGLSLADDVDRAVFHRFVKRLFILQDLNFDIRI